MKEQGWGGSQAKTWLNSSLPQPAGLGSSGVPQYHWALFWGQGADLWLHISQPMAVGCPVGRRQPSRHSGQVTPRAADNSWEKRAAKGNPHSEQLQGGSNSPLKGVWAGLQQCPPCVSVVPPLFVQLPKLETSASLSLILNISFCSVCHWSNFLDSVWEIPSGLILLLHASGCCWGSGNHYFPISPVIS